MNNKFTYAIYKFESQEPIIEFDDDSKADVLGQLNAEFIFYPTHDQKVFIAHEKDATLKSRLKLLNGKYLAKCIKNHANTQINGVYIDLNLENKTKLGSILKISSHSDIDQALAIKGIYVEEMKVILYRVDLYQFEFIKYLLDVTRTQIMPPMSTLTIANPSNFSFESRHVTIKAYQADLVEQKVSCIVNAANEHLKLMGGVAGDILHKGGKQIQHECDRYLSQRSLISLPVGEVALTSSGNINNCKYILHAVGPRWSDYRDKTECLNLLEKCFYTSLKYSSSNEMIFESISLPLISSGIFGVPREKCCECLLKAMLRYLNERKQDDLLRQIIICSIDNETNEVIVNYLNRNKHRLESLNEIKSNVNHETSVIQIEKKVIPSLNGTCSLCSTHSKSLTRPKNTCNCVYCPSCYPNYEQNKSCECA